MPRIKLHVKTTLLASVITIGMLITALIVTSAVIANLQRHDDNALAAIQAIDVTRHISDISSLHDPGALETAVNLVKGSRPNIVSVRIWDRNGDGFAEKVAATGSLPAEAVGADVR